LTARAIDHKTYLYGCYPEMIGEDLGWQVSEGLELAALRRVSQDTPQAVDAARLSARREAATAAQPQGN
jgi:hypothetical protein